MNRRVTQVSIKHVLIDDDGNVKEGSDITDKVKCTQDGSCKLIYDTVFFGELPENLPGCRPYMLAKTSNCENN